MYKITFGKDRYHQHVDMMNWCEQHFGPGGWYSIDQPSEYLWWIDQMFGNTTFRFKNERDFSKFVVKWDWANND